MGSGSGDKSGESETKIDRFLDTLVGEILKGLAAIALGFAGFQLGRLVEPKWLGSATCVLLFLSLVAWRKAHVLRKQLAALARKKAPPAAASPECISTPSPSEGMDDQAHLVLRMIVEAHDEDRVIKFPDIQKRMNLPKSALEVLLLWLEQEKYIWEEDDDSLQNDVGALHPLPKGASYVTSRKWVRPTDATWT